MLKISAVQYRSNVKWCRLIWPLCSRGKSITVLSSRVFVISAGNLLGLYLRWMHDVNGCL